MMRQDRVTVEVDLEVMMRYLFAGLLILMAGAVLFAAGSERVARAPGGRIGGSSSELGTRSEMSDIPVMSLRGDVAEVVVTAERPAGLMPEVVARANLTSEVVAQASRSTAALSALPSALSVN
jgi:hypothetical protein